MSNAQVNMSVRGLTKVFELGRGKSLTALNNINLDIMQGEILGLVGESGCGKSTLGKTLIKLHTESSGTIAFNGEDISGVMSSAKRKSFSRQVQMIFQDPYSCLNPRMTVEDIIAEGPDAHDMWKKEERREKVIQWLERVVCMPRISVATRTSFRADSGSESVLRAHWRWSRSL